MNLRFSALTALVMAMSAVAFPAYAELVVNSAPAAKAPLNLAPQGELIKFDKPTTSTIVVRDASATTKRGAPLASSSSTATGKPLSIATPKSQSTASGMTGRLTEVGASSQRSMIASVPGWADDLPLQIALSIVIPKDWSIQARGVDISKPVSYLGNKPWVEVLSDMTRSGNFNANVVWDRKLVVIFPAGSVDGTAIAPIAPVVSRQVVVATPVIPVVATPVVVAPVVQTWKIDPNLSLRGNIEAWTKQAGWNTVVWEAADYPMVAPAIFHGEFTSPTGPVATIVDAYRDSDQPLEVTLSTMDKVVHVTNKNYQVPTVAPTTPQQIVPQVFAKP